MTIRGPANHNLLGLPFIIVIPDVSSNFNHTTDHVQFTNQSITPKYVPDTNLVSNRESGRCGHAGARSTCRNGRASLPFDSKEDVYPMKISTKGVTIINVLQHPTSICNG